MVTYLSSLKKNSRMIYSNSLANTLKNAGCQIFLNTLDKIDGAKDLVLSKSILIQLDSICGMQKLRQNAVDKVFKLQASPVISETTNRVYVIRSSFEEVRWVARQINTYLNQDDDRLGPVDIKFWIIFVPRVTYYCNLALEEEGIYEYVSILECPLGLIPLEYDVYSLEDESIFETLFLHKDTTPLCDIVTAINQLQFLSGNIVDVHGQGRYAKIIADKLDQMNLTSEYKPKRSANSIDRENKANDFEGLMFRENKSQDIPTPAFTDLYILDRDCDYASTLLSQLNYEGILDEAFNICCNKLEFGVSSNDSEDKILMKHSLSSDSDPIYRHIRDNHFSTVFSLLKTKNHEMKDKYNRSQDMNLSNLKNFVVNELKNLQTEFKCLGLHISACEEIMRERNRYDFGDQLRTEQNIIDGVDIKKCLDYIKKMIDYQLNPHVPLRLLSLLSLIQGGLPPKDYEKFYSLYCKNYGLFNDVTFRNLRKLGLVSEMNLSLNALTGGLLNYSSNNDTNNQVKVAHITQSLSLASFTGAMSSLTEKASGRVAAVVSSSVLPRRGVLSIMLKKFQLVPEVGDAGYNIREPKDPAFVFGGAYIPLICQLVDNCVLSPPKRNPPLNITPTELMKVLPGPNFKRKQAFLNDFPASPRHSGNATNDHSILVFFVGGVTFAEVTALRFMAKQRNIRIAIATTSILNGNKLIECLFPKGR